MVAARENLGELARAAEARNTPDTLKRSNDNTSQKLRTTYKGVPKHPLECADEVGLQVCMHVSFRMMVMSSDDQTGIY